MTRLADAQRQRQLGPGLGQIGVGEVNGVGADVEGDARLAGAGDVAHQADLAHGQSVTAGQHVPAALGRGGPQHGVVAFDQEDAGVIVVEARGDQVDDLVEQGIDVANEGGVAGDLRRGLDLMRALGDALLQRAVHRRQLRRHAVERLGQPSDLVAPPDRDALFELPVGDALDDLRQSRQRPKRRGASPRAPAAAPPGS